MNFKKGQKVVCVDDRIYGTLKPLNLKKGNIYTVDGFSCCTDCGLATIFVAELNEKIISVCICGHSQLERQNYLVKRFVPAEDTAQQDLLKESISEVKIERIKIYA